MVGILCNRIQEEFECDKGCGVINTSREFQKLLQHQNCMGQKDDAWYSIVRCV